MSGAVTIAAVAAAVVAWYRPAAWPVALPFLLLWMASPLAARRISLPRRAEGAPPPSSTEARALRLHARRTWRFFTTFVGPEDHALPPDNFQEDPQVVAHRTSPTNVGLYLLSTVAAHDFGWIGTLEAGERLEATFATMTNLERFRGHLYNWSDTKDGRPLDPRYVSSVDSGNLAGHLIAFASACREMSGQPGPGRPALDGVEDAASLVRESLRALAGAGSTRRGLDEALEAFTTAGQAIPDTPAAWAERLAELDARAHTVTTLARALIEEDPGAQTVLAWADALRATWSSSRRRTLPARSPVA